jgi:hypothetical protein
MSVFNSKGRCIMGTFICSCCGEECGYLNQCMTCSNDTHTDSCLASDGYEDDLWEDTEVPHGDVCINCCYCST